MEAAAEVAVVVATVLCSLVAGFLLAFAVVVMPGIRRLGDREFLRAFQEIDRVIQRGDPLFERVWIGSALSAVVALVVGVGQMDGLERMLLALASGVYVFGVRLPTFVVNVPLDNEIQALHVDGADAGAQARGARHGSASSHAGIAGMQSGPSSRSPAPRPSTSCSPGRDDDAACASSVAGPGGRTGHPDAVSSAGQGTHLLA